MEQLPDGEMSVSLESEINDNNPGVTVGSQVYGQVSQVLKHPAIWLIAAYSICFSLALGTMNSHQIAYIQDLGFSPMTAATTLSLVSGLGIAGSLGFGTLAIKYNIRYLALSCFILQL